MSILDKNIITITNSKGEVKKWEVIESAFGLDCIVRSIEAVIENPINAVSWLEAVKKEEIAYLEVKVEVLAQLKEERK